ncbi:hypothetical protein B0H10DRAFT_2011180 [Mycena sp. CBHHK59/15]|nr:hypothetical protein B0H10DRAFT_2011180 [Mycena sp. CBHHK59/15]
MSQPEHNRTQLNNTAAQQGRSVQYSNTQSGPLDNATWTSIVYVNGYEFGRAEARTKAGAQEGAARQAIALIAQGY